MPFVSFLSGDTFWELMTSLTDMASAVATDETKPTECKDWTEVRLYTSPWVSGAKLIQSLGSASVEFLTEDMEGGIIKSEEMLQQKAFKLGGNAVVGWERTIFLFDKPIRIKSEGSVCSLGTN
jgi:hypothetical protein